MADTKILKVTFVLVLLLLCVARIYYLYCYQLFLLNMASTEYLGVEHFDSDPPISFLE